MQKWIILIVICVIIIIGAFVVINMDIETEYTPEGEVEEEELRKTLITLYFKNKETGELGSETRLIDSKELLLEPYEKFVKLLTQGPENEKFEKVIPENVNYSNIEFKNGYVNITFSDNLLDENISDETRSLMATSIYYTLSNLTEVNGIRILVGDSVIADSGTGFMSDLTN